MRSARAHQTTLLQYHEHEPEHDCIIFVSMLFLLIADEMREKKVRELRSRVSRNKRLSGGRVLQGNEMQRAEKPNERPEKEYAMRDQ